MLAALIATCGMHTDLEAQGISLGHCDSNFHELCGALSASSGTCSSLLTRTAAAAASFVASLSTLEP